MEAATARYATRDRFSTFGAVQTPLQRYIRMRYLLLLYLSDTDQYLQKMP